MGDCSGRATRWPIPSNWIYSRRQQEWICQYLEQNIADNHNRLACGCYSRSRANKPHQSLWNRIICIQLLQASFTSKFILDFLALLSLRKCTNRLFNNKLEQSWRFASSNQKYGVCFVKKKFLDTRTKHERQAKSLSLPPEGERGKYYTQENNMFMQRLTRRAVFLVVKQGR